jgi:hypothetical protein
VRRANRSHAITLGILILAEPGVAHALTDAGFDGGVAPGLDGGADAGAPTCGLHTGFDGDELCLLPPPGGLQLHFGPDDYANPDQVAPFLASAGEERVDCYVTTTPNTAVLWAKRFEVHARPGIHRAALWALSAPPVSGPGLAASCDDALGPDATLLAAVRETVTELSPSDAPEYADLAWQIPAAAPIAFEVHWINLTPEPQLREIWWNVLPSSAPSPRPAQTVSLRSHGTPILPGEAATPRFGCDAPGDVAITTMTATMSAQVQALTAWVVRADSSQELVYASYDWASPPTLAYDSVTQNPAHDASAALSGGSSGPLELHAGDRIEWECEIANPLDMPLDYDSTATYTSVTCDLAGVAAAAQGWSCLDDQAPSQGGMDGVAGTAGTGGAPTASGGTGGLSVGAGATAATGAAPSSDAGSSSDVAHNAADSGSDGGCGCHVGRRPRRGAPWAGLALAWVLGRRRRGARAD